MADIDSIELRSEKTRQIIGMVPSGIVRYGTLIITIIIAILLAVSYFVPYPENLQANVTVVVDADGKLNVCAYFPYSHIDKTVHKNNGQNYFKVYLNSQSNNTITLLEGVNGTANILISNKSVLQKMFKR